MTTSLLAAQPIAAPGILIEIFTLNMNGEKRIAIDGAFYGGLHDGPAEEILRPRIASSIANEFGVTLHDLYVSEYDVDGNDAARFSGMLDQDVEQLTYEKIVALVKDYEVVPYFESVAWAQMEEAVEAFFSAT